MTNTYTNPPIVLSHAGCCDGYTAAWVARRAYPTAEIRFLNYGDPVPEELVKGRDVVLLDFSFKRPEMLWLIDIANSVLVLDHHKTAQTELSNIVDPLTEQKATIVFDMERSGCQLAWDEFFPGLDRPNLIDYVADRDLWKFELPDSEAVNTAIMSHNFHWDTWDRLNLTDTETLAREGKLLIRQRDREITRIMSNAKACTFHGLRAVIVNSPCFQSEIGNHVLEKGLGDIGIVWYYKQGKFVYSLRSKSDAVDVGKIASEHGGGGHPRAAGFMSPTLIIP